jgi:hypothetical protein
MQTLIRMDMVGIDDYYHMARMHEKLSHPIFNHFSKYEGPFLYIYLYWKCINSIF